MKWILTFSQIAVSAAIAVWLWSKDPVYVVIFVGACVWQAGGISLWWSNDHAEWWAARKNFPHILSWVVAALAAIIFWPALAIMLQPVGAVWAKVLAAWSEISPSMGLSCCYGFALIGASVLALVVAWRLRHMST